MILKGVFLHKSTEQCTSTASKGHDYKGENGMYCEVLLSHIPHNDRVLLFSLQLKF